MIPKTMMPLAAALGLCLGACSDEPSESDMRFAASTLLTRMYSAQAGAAAFLTGSPRGAPTPAPTVTTFRKIGCEPASPSLGGHVCGFEAAINGGAAVPGKGRFFKAADGTLALAQ